MTCRLGQVSQLGSSGSTVQTPVGSRIGAASAALHQDRLVVERLRRAVLDLEDRAVADRANQEGDGPRRRLDQRIARAWRPGNAGLGRQGAGDIGGGDGDQGHAAAGREADGDPLAGIQQKRGVVHEV